MPQSKEKKKKRKKLSPEIDHSSQGWVSYLTSPEKYLFSHLIQRFPIPVAFTLFFFRPFYLVSLSLLLHSTYSLSRRILTSFTICPLISGKSLEFPYNPNTAPILLAYGPVYLYPPHEGLPRCLTLLCLTPPPPPPE